MVHVAIVYFSHSGLTKQVAEAIGEGVAQVAGASHKLHAISGDDIHAGRWKNESIVADLNAADAIVFGTPTYMGGYSAQFKSFIDACGGIWYQQGWKNKLAAGFTHSQGLSGDKLSTLQGLCINAMQHGMLWVGTATLPEGSKPENTNRISSYLGVMAQTDANQTTINIGDKAVAIILGKRVAETATRLK
jgi:NAD(P)H dehydrogenase (quinone)